MKRKEEILKEMEEIKEEMNSLQVEFINQYMKRYRNVYNKEIDKLETVENFESLSYLDDAISEFIDGSISVYYDDQLEYYRKDPTRATQCFVSFGYELNQFIDLEEAVCKSGVCMWWADISDELREDNRLEGFNELVEKLEDLENE